MVVASPPATTGLIKVRVAFAERLLGLVSDLEQIRHLTAGLLPFVGAVWGNQGVELAHPVSCRGAGMAEPLDVEGERVIRSDTRRDHPGPVVIKPVAKPHQAFSPPPFARLEALERDLVAAKRLDAGGDVVTRLPGGSRLLAVGDESVL